MSTGSVLAYQGRTVDLLMFQGVTGAVGEQSITTALVDSNGYSYVTTGIEKLAQRMFSILFTPKGSMPYLPAYGTSFLLDANLGKWNTVPAVQLSYNAAQLDLMRQLTAVQTATDPLDEQIGTVTLTDVSVTQGTVTLWFAITTQAGTSQVFIAPVPIVI